MSKRNVHVFLGMVAATGLWADASEAQDAKAVLLRTSTSIGYLAPNGANAVAKNTGAGVMDAKPAIRKIANGTGFVTRIGTLFTVEAANANGAGSHMQGALYIGDITEQGLQHRAVKMMPELDGERAFMRPLVQWGQNLNFGVLIAASEDNGNNNNPQPVAYITDLDGNILPIANSTRGGNIAKPTNLVDLSGNQDAQQYGPHSICSLGPDAGGESFLVGVQRNNANAYIMKVKVEPAPGGAKVTVPFFKEVHNNATHCRPQVTCPMPGVSPMAYVTTVDANAQPADGGILAIEVNPATGDVVRKKNVAESDPDGTKFGAKMYAVQNSGLIHLGNGLAAIGYQVSSHQKKNADGHSGGANMSVVASLRLSDMQVIERTAGVAPYQRHAFSFPMMFGKGNGVPAVAVMGGSSTGTGKGKIQLVEFDGAGKAAVNPDHVLDVSLFSDVANLPARGKRNPNDQGAGFLNGVYGAENPGYGKPNGFLPEVRTFFVSALPGYADDPIKTPTINRESLWVSLVPATWDEKVDAVPGPVTQDVPPGPSPVVNTQTGQITAPSSTGTAPAATAPTTPAANGSLPPPQGGGCACSTPASQRSPEWFDVAGLVLGFGLLARRSRRARRGGHS